MKVLSRKGKLPLTRKFHSFSFSSFCTTVFRTKSPAHCVHTDRRRLWWAACALWPTTEAVYSEQTWARLRQEAASWKVRAAKPSQNQFDFSQWLLKGSCAAERLIHWFFQRPDEPRRKGWFWCCVKLNFSYKLLINQWNQFPSNDSD